MHARELIGYFALRTRPTKTKWGHDDWSFNTEPVYIVNATSTHVYYRSHSKGAKTHILSYIWVDDWVKYEPEPTKKEK